MEKHLIEQQQELIQKSDENFRRHVDDVAMIRHDMYKHFTVMRDLKGEDTIKEYLSALVSQYQAIRPV